MARFSTHNRFFIWDLGSDNYNHTQLASNLDSIDTLFGAPNSGTWPSVGQSVYSYIATLQSLVEPVGTVRMFLAPTSAVPIPGGTGGVPDSLGWCVCDGSVVASNNHSFKDGSGNAISTSITLPDFQNRSPLGANISLPFGQAGTTGDGSTHAPGVFGLQGTNAAKSVNQTLPDHYHEHNHIHEVGNINGGGFETGDASQANNHPVTFTTGTSGSQLTLPGLNHHHHFDIYSSLPRLPDDANYSVAASPDSNSVAGLFHTSTQALMGGGTADNPQGGNPGDPLSVSTNVDLRNASVGVVFVMKVKDVLVK